MRSRSKFLALVLTSALAGVTFGAENTTLDQAVLKHFSDAATYSRKDKFSSSVPVLYLAYDRQGRIIKGAALRKIKTYKRVTALLVVEKKDGKFIVTAAEIPDIGRIRDQKKRHKVLSAIKRLQGKVVKSADGKTQKVDAVTGATRYQRRIYDGFDVMARKIVEQMETGPNWEKIRCNRHASTTP